MSELVRAQTVATLSDKIKYAEHLAQSGLLPASYKQQPANVLLAMEYGDALGIHQMTAINEINVISGRPAMSASLMQSLARAAGHKVRVSGDAERAVCTIVRKDDPDFEHTSEWTKAKAESSGLWGRGHWAKDPALMLKWRAISECVRLACSEVLSGLKYTPEEVLEFTSREYKQDDVVEQPPVAPREQHPEPAGASAPEPVGPDAVDQRMTDAWDNLDGLRKLYRWLRGQDPSDARLVKIQERGQQLEAQAANEVHEGEIVEEAQAETLPMDEGANA
ncbi:hypothetical protein [Nesterenkonia jeotgali]|uniref:Recombinase RecT n=1 Tax=Nesterenkonia jeotgali TaxID=317018 RepID=A0A0W8IGF3_9MICC|nr:hypothetical protein [Nesterenkonia jeotgali]KUG58947.1 hypothetical protein AVL63_02685 [Nesterenkonia jeotgali]